MRGTHEPQRQKPWHMSSSGSTWRTCVSCTNASLCFAARWMTSSGGSDNVISPLPRRHQERCEGREDDHGPPCLCLSCCCGVSRTSSFVSLSLCSFLVEVCLAPWPPSLLRNRWSRNVQRLLAFGGSRLSADPCGQTWCSAC